MRGGVCPLQVGVATLNMERTHLGRGDMKHATEQGGKTDPGLVARIDEEQHGELEAEAAGGIFVRENPAPVRILLIGYVVNHIHYLIASFNKSKAKAMQ